MTKTKIATLALLAMASASAIAAAPQSAQAFGRGIAVGEVNPGRGRFHDGGFRRVRFFDFRRFRFRHFNHF